MPDDPDSAAYGKWEKAREDLEQEIDELAEEIYGWRFLYIPQFHLYIVSSIRIDIIYGKEVAEWPA